MKIGVSLPQTTNYDLTVDVVAYARAAEQIGFDSVWVIDRLLQPVDHSGPHGLYGMPGRAWPNLYGQVCDPLVTLTLAAATTDRIALGTGVLVAPLHLPVRLAKSLACLDAVSGGRVLAGLGSGWSIDEFAATAPRPITERGAALDEFLDIAAAVWGSDPVAFAGDRYTIAPARINPKPAGRIPLYLAGTSPAALNRVARRADGWLPTGLSPAQAAAMLAGLREQAEAAGRDPATIDCVFQLATGSFTDVPTVGRMPYTGSVKQQTNDIAALAEAGIQHVYVTVAWAARTLNEAIDLSAALYETVRSAGL